MEVQRGGVGEGAGDGGGGGKNRKKRKGKKREAGDERGREIPKQQKSPPPSPSKPTLPV